MRIASEANAGKVAGAITGLLRNGQEAVLEAIGAGAVYQAVNAILVSGIFMKDEGIIPTVTIDSETRGVAGIKRKTLLFTVTPNGRAGK